MLRAEPRRSLDHLSAPKQGLAVGLSCSASASSQNIGLCHLYLRCVSLIYLFYVRSIVSFWCVPPVSRSALIRLVPFCSLWSLLFFCEFCSATASVASFFSPQCDLALPCSLSFRSVCLTAVSILLDILFIAVCIVVLHLLFLPSLSIFLFLFLCSFRYACFPKVERFRSLVCSVTYFRTSPSRNTVSTMSLPTAVLFACQIRHSLPHESLMQHHDNVWCKVRNVIHNSAHAPHDASVRV